MSNKPEKFVRLAENRVNKALKDIQLIGNLCNRNAYEYADDDVRKIFSSLQGGLNSAKARFSKESSDSGGEFRL